MQVAYLTQLRVYDCILVILNASVFGMAISLLHGLRIALCQETFK